MPKRIVSVYLPADLLAQLDSWRARQLVPPARSAIVEQAIREFMRAHRPRRPDRKP